MVFCIWEAKSFVGIQWNPLEFGIRPTLIWHFSCGRFNTLNPCSFRGSPGSPPRAACARLWCRSLGRRNPEHKGTQGQNTEPGASMDAESMQREWDQQGVESCHLGLLTCCGRCVSDLFSICPDGPFSIEGHLRSTGESSNSMSATVGYPKISSYSLCLRACPKMVHTHSWQF